MGTGGPSGSGIDISSSDNGNTAPISHCDCYLGACGLPTGVASKIPSAPSALA